jgi:hypothetical protein
MRPVEKTEAAAPLARLVKEGKIVQIALQDDARTEYLVRTVDFPLLEKLHAREIPDEWRPLDTSTSTTTYLEDLDCPSLSYLTRLDNLI